MSTDKTDQNSDDENELAEMQELLDQLKAEHRRIDREIKANEEMGVIDALKIRRMKKIKLSLKDQIVYLENQLTPDIIA